MIDLLAPLALVLALLRGEALPPPRCEKPRPCPVWTGRRFDCMRRHRGGPCDPYRRRRP